MTESASTSDDGDISDAELDSIESVAAAATPGPWFMVQLDDDNAAALRAVATAEIPAGTRWPAFNSDQLVAATLVQHPLGYVLPADNRWDENARFISRARSDVPRLIEEIRRLRALKDQ